MIRYGHYGNVSQVAEEMDRETLLEIICAWEQALYNQDDPRWQTAADAHYLLRQMIYEEVSRQLFEQEQFEYEYGQDL